MSGKVRVGTNKLTFTVSAFDYPREDFATAVVDVPVYAKSDNVLKDQRSMSVEAVMPEDFNEKVEHALQVFADTLEASFKEGTRENSPESSTAPTMTPTRKECGIERSA